MMNTIEMRAYFFLLANGNDEQILSFKFLLTYSTTLILVGSHMVNSLFFYLVLHWNKQDIWERAMSHFYD